MLPVAWTLVWYTNGTPRPLRWKFKLNPRPYGGGVAATPPQVFFEDGKNRWPEALPYLAQPVRHTFRMFWKNKFEPTLSGHGTMTFAPIRRTEHFDPKARYPQMLDVLFCHPWSIELSGWSLTFGGLQLPLLTSYDLKWPWSNIFPKFHYTVDGGKKIEQNE